MGNLIKEWVKGILTENINKKVVVYAGRFQPFHKGHYATYQNLVKEFGKDNVYIGTSDKTDNIKSPFKFKEKKEIMMKMFGISSNKIVQIKNPYAPAEIVSKFDKSTTAFITVVGEKDRYRLKGKYFQPYHPDKIEKGYEEVGYVYVAPAQSNPISGTDVRNWLSKGSEEERKDGFKKAYGKFDPKIFKLVSDRLYKIESVMERFVKQFDVESLINEASGIPNSGKGLVDDGPGAFIGNFKTYKAEQDKVANQLGWKVINYLMDDDFQIEFDTDYPNGPGRYPVSYFPTGIAGKGSARYGAIKGKEMRSKPAFAKWAKHIKKVATVVGYKLINFLDAEDAKTLQSNQPLKELKTQQLHTEGVLNDVKAEVQVKKINISFELFDGTKISEDITLAMSPNSQGVFELGDNVAKYTGLSLKDAQEYNETPDDAYAYGLVNTMNDGQDIYFWTNGTRLAGKAKKAGAQTAVIEQLAHEGLHLTRAILAKSLMGDKFPTGEWPSMGEQGNDTIEEEQLTTALSFVIEHITPSFIEMAKKYISKPKDKSLAENILTEGGAYGHMAHPFDIEMNLTFGDLKQIIRGALTGNLELAREKTDGQALAISWRDDRGLIAARNGGHLKNKGEKALDISGVATKFAGRGELEKAYNFAMKDLNDAVKGLSKAQRDMIFKQGASFMNLEVIYPTSVNVIPYDQPLLVFHNTIEYDDAGNAIGANQPAAKILAGMIKQINKDVQQNYTIQGPPVTELPKNIQLPKLQSKFESQVKKLQSEFNLKDSNGVADYHQAWWENWVDKNSPSTLDNKTKMGLVKRWAFLDKSFRLDKKNITDSKVLDWATKIDKQDQSKMAKDNLLKFEYIFLGVGAEVLSFMSSVLAVNPDKAVRDMKARLDQTVKDVQKLGDPKKIEKLKLELQRLASIGGKDKIVPNEGIVFVYKGNTYKLTGTFAPLNQILGLFYE